MCSRTDCGLLCIRGDHKPVYRPGSQLKDHGASQAPGQSGVHGERWRRQVAPILMGVGCASDESASHCSAAQEKGGAAPLPFAAEGMRPAVRAHP